MFTGIVTDIGTIRSIEKRGDLRLVIDCDYEIETIALGASIACSGVCLTVVDKGREADGSCWFAVDASTETVSCTAGHMWQQGQKLNLERALKLGEELGGHIVTGHVDGVARVNSIAEEGDSRRVSFMVKADLAPFIAAKGSATINGVSLTVNEVQDLGEDTQFTVNLIPHTWSVTTLGDLREGQEVNVEIDVLARYLGRLKERFTMI